MCVCFARNEVTSLTCENGVMLTSDKPRICAAVTKMCVHMIITVYIRYNWFRKKRNGKHQAIELLDPECKFYNMLKRLLNLCMHCNRILLVWPSIFDTDWRWLGVNLMGAKFTFGWLTTLRFWLQMENARTKNEYIWNNKILDNYNWSRWIKQTAYDIVFFWKLPERTHAQNLHRIINIEVLL